MPRALNRPGWARTGQAQKRAGRERPNFLPRRLLRGSDDGGDRGEGGGDPGMVHNLPEDEVPAAVLTQAISQGAHL